MVKVKKANGTLEDYSENKVRTSLIRAGADEIIIETILDNISKKIYEGISTQDIYSIIFNELKAKNHLLVSRYNLKHAIMELGPTGFPFEKFFAGVLNQYGYKTETNVVVKGSCVQHEIDVIAEKDGKRIMIEAKFHQRSGIKSAVKTALYTHARFLDCKDENNFNDHWLVTNTKATQDAVEYGICNGMKVISWDKPHDFSLRHLVEKSNLHPITALEYLSKDHIRDLFDEGIVFVKDMKSEN